MIRREFYCDTAQWGETIQEIANGGKPLDELNQILELTGPEILSSKWDPEAKTFAIEFGKALKLSAWKQKSDLIKEYIASKSECAKGKWAFKGSENNRNREPVPYNMASIYLDDYGQQIEAAEVIKANWHNLIDHDFVDDDSAQKMFQSDQQTKAALQIVLMFTVALLLVASLGVFTIFSLNTKAKTSEIGMLRTIGFTQTAINKLLLLESLIVWLVSTTIGFCIAYLVGWGFSIWKVQNEIDWSHGFWQGISKSLFCPWWEGFHAPLWLVMAVVFCSMVICFIFSWIPANRWRNTDPIVLLEN